MPETLRVADVVPDVPTAGLEESYTYGVGDTDPSPGDCVLVPFGNRVVGGYVIAVRDVVPNQLGFPESNLKPIQSVVDGLSLPDELLETIRRTAKETLSPLGAVVRAALPPGIRSRLKTVYRVVQYAGDVNLTPKEAEALDKLRERGEVAESALTSLGLSRSVMLALVRKRVVSKEVTLPPERKPRQRPLRLAEGGARPREDTPAQLRCYEVLLRSGGGGWTVEEIAALADVSAATVRALAKDGVLEEAPAPREASTDPPRMTPHQMEAISAIAANPRGRFLLFGVTGSGKTEVYMRVIRDAIDSGRSVLYLVPEIALASQVITQLRSRFSERVAVIHSGLSHGERLRQWRAVRSGSVQIALGARSAAFAPAQNLGVVIVDEEHESAYKEDGSPHHDARKVVEMRADLSGARLLLGSATPSVESFHRARTGGLQLVSMPSRVGDLSLPDVVVSDLREVFRAGKPSILGPELHVALSETLRRGEQAILFLNRRAYAGSLLCRECGHVPACPNCTVTLTFHKAAKRLRCHHCNAQEPAPDVCPKCGSTRFRPLGIGTEKVEEAVRKAFPRAAVARLDRDVARRAGAVEAVFRKLREGEVNVLVGTQMVAKGLDFPGVTLVGVVTADTGLCLPDFRSTERTFQLLTQVCGRSGRAQKGTALIQTFQPNHPAVKFAAAQDYETFFDREIGERRDALYPPFTRLVNVVASSQDRGEAERLAFEIADDLKRHVVRVLGPSPCPIERLKGQWRYHVLVKLEPEEDVGVAAVPEERLTHPNVRVTVDVDPVSLL
ncbi:MAG: primosomal protein N' [Armatimonadota bacterium]